MTEVPEHLLQRSRERRAAIGGGGGGDAGAAAPAPAAGDEPGTAVAATASAEVAPAAAAAVEEAPPPPPPPPYVQAALARPKIPRFAIPALAALPLWALIYAGTLTAGGGEELDPQLAMGRDVYAANCASCHGAGGEGGTGRPLNEVLETFPDPQGHVDWVINGSPAAGTEYGAQGRTSQSDGYGPMPGFGGALSEEEIAAVVRWERVEYGGQPADEAVEAGGGGDQADQAQNEGGDVGGDSAEGGGDSAAPSDEGDSETQPESEATDDGGQDETDAGSGSGGDPEAG